ISFLATTGGISGDDVRDLMVATVEHRFGRVNRLPVTIEWLSDNGSCYAHVLQTCADASHLRFLARFRPAPMSGEAFMGRVKDGDRARGSRSVSRDGVEAWRRLRDFAYVST